MAAADPELRLRKDAYDDDRLCAAVLLRTIGETQRFGRRPSIGTNGLVLDGRSPGRNGALSGTERAAAGARQALKARKAQ